MADKEMTVAPQEEETQDLPDLVALGYGRRGKGSIQELSGKHKDDSLFHEVWQEILRNREVQREAAERGAAE